MLQMKLTTQSMEIFVIGLYSIHFVNLSMATNTWVKPSQRENHVQAPASKRPGWWYGDEVMRRDMSLPAEELAIVTPTNKIFSVSQSCLPAIPRPKYFPD
jgi:hypothetical protein